MLDLDRIQQLLRRAARSVADQRATLDALNVFPVADDDTGANLAATLAVLADAAMAATDHDDLVQQVRRAALSGQGNSGLIMGQWWSGFIAELSFVDAARAARRAVANPVEGTMISLADAVASVAVEPQPAHWRSILPLATGAVERTPDQLAVLAEAGVVDSGAVGLWIVVAELGEIDSTIPAHWHRAPEARAAASSITTVVGHEIQFRCERSEIAEGDLRQVLVEFGTDVVVAATDGELSAHVHISSLDPAELDASLARLRSMLGSWADDLVFDIEPLVVAGA